MIWYEWKQGGEGMLQQRTMLKIPKKGEKKNEREKEKVDGCQELKEIQRSKSNEWGRVGKEQEVSSTEQKIIVQDPAK